MVLEEGFAWLMELCDGVSAEGLVVPPGLRPTPPFVSGRLRSNGNADRHARLVPRRRGEPDSLCAVHQPRLDAIGGLAIRGATGVLLPHHRPTGVPDGLSDADGDDDAGPPWKGAHVHLGVGRQCAAT